MKTIGLITPCEPDPDVEIHKCLNPGSMFITHGIQYLCRQVLPDCRFEFIEMCKHRREHWERAAKCDVLILCGNPRFNSVEDKVYWDWNVWRYISRCIDAGVKFVDGWAGSAWPWPPQSIANITTGLSRVRKNMAVLKDHESRACMVIARDEPAFRLLAEVSDNAHWLPCSTWYAADWHGVESAEKTCHAVTLRAMPGNAWMFRHLREITSSWDTLPVRFICHTHNDMEWLERAGCDLPDVTVIEDPPALLKFYAQVDKLLSFRLHGSVPALRLGARVCDMAIDSRGHTLKLFGVRSVNFHKIAGRGWQPEFQTPIIPDIDETLKTLRSIL